MTFVLRNILIMSLVIVSVAVMAETSESRTWYIKPDGTGDAPTIQAGIHSSMAGDTVLVAAGRYEG